MRATRSGDRPTSASSSTDRSTTSRARSRAAGVAIELGPVEREGAAGALESLYVRDPDGNLVELSRDRPI